MKVSNNPYKNFKPYSHYRGNKLKPEKNEKIAVKSLIGSAVGVGSAFLFTNKFMKKENSLNELAKVFLMVGSANVGGVLGGSIEANSDSKKRKWKEAGFQVMNTMIPMTLVTSALEICKRVKKLNNNPSKIIGSIVGMVSGAMLATKITNLTKKDDEEKRKYTIKDSVANFDDVVATIAIGFKDINKYIHADRFLPFIYAYSGARAGSKE